MNYEEMSDFEINRSVAAIIFPDSEVPERGDALVRNSTQCQVIHEPAVSGELKDYCNNPSDAWPVIVENKIAVMPDSDDTWKAGNLPAKKVVGWANFIRGQNNPLRTAMIVFLKMKGAAQ